MVHGLRFRVQGVGFRVNLDRIYCVGCERTPFCAARREELRLEMRDPDEPPTAEECESCELRRETGASVDCGGGGGVWKPGRINTRKACNWSTMPSAVPTPLPGAERNGAACWQPFECTLHRLIAASGARLHVWWHPQRWNGDAPSGQRLRLASQRFWAMPSTWLLHQPCLTLRIGVRRPSDWAAVDDGVM